MNSEPIKEFVALSCEKKIHERALKHVNERIAILEPIVEAEFASMGCEQLKMSGKTIYLRRYVSAKIKDGFEREDVIDALLKSEYHDLVKLNYNTKTLNALVSEQAKEVLQISDIKIIEPLQVNEYFKPIVLGA